MVMTGLEVFGVACNVMQAIDLSLKTIRLCKDIYNGRAPEADVQNNAASMMEVSAQIDGHCQLLKPKVPDEQKLVSVAADCDKAARAVEDEVKKITKRGGKGKVLDTVQVATKSIWRKSQLDRLEKRLDRYRNTMEAHLLIRVCKQTDAIKMQQNDGFTTLSGDLQHFVNMLAQGTTELSELIKSEHDSTRQHTTTEASRAAESVKAHVTEKITQNKQELSAAATTSAQSDRLLGSLKYPLMNERINAVADKPGVGFNQIFRTKDGDTTSYDSSGSDETSQAKDADTISKSSLEFEEVFQANDSEIARDNFPAWLESDNDLFWISGKPGSGKSTLVWHLINSSETKEALDAWMPGSVILSHFFWKPGSEMQKNIKGLLCSLIYQALSLEHRLIEKAIASSFSLGSKDSFTDWTVKELEALLSILLDAFSSALCIFIDGLDEISDHDGHSKLLQTIHGIRRHQRVKVCVSSRPETRFLSQLEHHPCLKVQDLTRGDMHRFLVENLIPHCTNARISSSMEDMLIFELIEKSEGVFLWLHLASHSVITGIENRDGEALLLHRLQQLPTDLSKLYTSMWAKLNQDQELYRQDAARYFNFMITTHEDNASYHRSDEFPYRLSLIQLVAATNILDGISIDERVTSEGSGLYQACNNMRHAIQLRCAGLLELHTVSITEFYEPWYRSIWGTEPVSVITFIHRTAYDFLTDTVDGKRILAFDKTSNEERIIQLVKGDLAQVAILRYGKRSVTPLLHRLSQVKRPSMQKERDKLLRVMDIMIGLGKLNLRPELTDFRWPNYVDKPSPHLFVILAAYPIFRSFIVSELGTYNDPRRLATHILRELWSRIESYIPLEESTVSLVVSLLSLGADPNTRGICMNYYSDDKPVVVHFHPFQSAFSSFLRFAWNASQRIDSREHLLFLVSVFLNSRPDLTIRTYLPLRLDKSDLQGKVELFEGSFRYSEDDYRLHESDVAADNDDVIDRDLVLDTNLAFLVDVVRRRLQDETAGGHDSPIISGSANSAQRLATPSANIAYSLQAIGASSSKAWYNLKQIDPVVSRRMFSQLEPCLYRYHEELPELFKSNMEGLISDLNQLAQNPSSGCELQEGLVAASLAKDDLGFCSVRTVLEDPERYMPWTRGYDASMLDSFYEFPASVLQPGPTPETRSSG